MANEVNINVVSLGEPIGVANRKSRWVKLPMEEQELINVLNSIKLTEDSELRITDVEGPFEFGQYEDIIQSNRVLSKIIEEGIDLEYVATVLDFNCSTLIDFFDIYDKQQYEYYSNVNGLEEVAEIRVRNGYYGNVSDDIMQYVDMEQIATDMNCNGWMYYPKYRTAIFPIGG